MERWQRVEAVLAAAVRALRLRRGPHADHRARGAVRQGHGRDDGHRPEGDVRVHRQGRRAHHAAARSDAEPRARLRRAQPRADDGGAEDLPVRPDVPVRAAAEGPVPPVPPARRRGLRRGRPGRSTPRCIDLAWTLVTRTRHRRRRTRRELGGLPGVPARVRRGAGQGARRGRRQAVRRLPAARRRRTRSGSSTARCRRTSPSSTRCRTRSTTCATPCRDALRRGRAAPRRCTAFRTGVSHRLVRGLDYYTRTTFEILAGNIGAQNAILGGGRYDGLVKQLGGPDRVGIGFAAGIERLVLAMPDDARRPGAGARSSWRRWATRRGTPALALLRDLRRAGLEAHMEYEGRSIKSQMKRADRLKAAYALILGDDELAARRGEREGHDDRRAGARRARRGGRVLPGPRGRRAGVAQPWWTNWATGRARTRAASCARTTSGATVLLLGWVHRVRDLGAPRLPRPARPLRADAGGVRGRGPARPRQAPARRVRHRRPGPGPPARGRGAQREDADRRRRGRRARAEGAERGEGAAVRHRRRGGGVRGTAAEVPLPRPAAARRCRPTSACATA